MDLLFLCAYVLWLEVFVMCRKNQLSGCALMAFGLGILVGLCLESGFFCFVIGFVIIGLGAWCAAKK